jgi:hypothetical protein
MPVSANWSPFCGVLTATLRSSTNLARQVTNGIIRYNGTFGIFRIYRKLKNDIRAGFEARDMMNLCGSQCLGSLEGISGSKPH